jgi:prepilin-type N-terminal cleavage/methylation domain-containing protein
MGGSADQTHYHINTSYRVHAELRRNIKKKKRMRIQTSRKSGFTLVEIMIVVAIIGLLAAIAIPNFVKARTAAQKNVCLANMKQIDGAVEQFALETKLAQGADVTIAQICGAGLYIKTEPKCPAGSASYAAQKVGTLPVCPNIATAADHVLQ